jgi:hypothetical protein
MRKRKKKKQVVCEYLKENFTGINNVEESDIEFMFRILMICSKAAREKWMSFFNRRYADESIKHSLIQLG